MFNVSSIVATVLVISSCATTSKLSTSKPISVILKETVATYQLGDTLKAQVLFVNNSNILLTLPLNVPHVFSLWRSSEVIENQDAFYSISLNAFDSILIIAPGDSASTVIPFVSKSGTSPPCGEGSFQLLFRFDDSPPQKDRWYTIVSETFLVIDVLCE